ncbi:MAG: hypothetical protein AW10_02075 [Candidatus Accumulibacter appositus]|uniref:Uncharacterized protein n=1 Tax=Candidatus Accumulibacter appositus TaxID=1454003 RepID=A0A011PSX0_9PROT|nr:MAG: hypothetical protein AW10_02075 [Candidatus Accumulibacter appositus]
MQQPSRARQDQPDPLLAVTAENRVVKVVGCGDRWRTHARFVVAEDRRMRVITCCIVPPRSLLAGQTALPLERSEFVPGCRLSCVP